MGDSRNHGHGWDSWAGVVAQNRKGQTLASQISLWCLLLPNTFNRQKSHKPSTLDSVNDLASLISLAFLSTKTARGEPALHSLFTPVCWTHVRPWCYSCRGINTSHGAYGSRADPAAYLNTCSESFWQNLPGIKIGMWRGFIDDAQQKPAVSLMIICIHWDLFNKGIHTQKELLLGNTHHSPAKVFS